MLWTGNEEALEVDGPRATPDNGMVDVVDLLAIISAWGSC